MSGGQIPPFQSRIYIGQFPGELRLESLIPILEKFGKLWELSPPMSGGGESNLGYAEATF